MCSKGTRTKLFVDPKSRDFRSRPGSPTIDAGMGAGVPEDFRGVKRPQGRADDIGGYEEEPDRDSR